MLYTMLTMNTVIRVRQETRELLREIGKKRQTYDDIINDLASKAGLNVKKELSS
jgi:hypothetical protein